ncbi:MAG: hypothetical protein IJ141_05680 [Lachnospiraceae bacterium]|nr:hypothetical protein [Lachnospiraceae bacterium]
MSNTNVNIAYQKAIRNLNKTAWAQMSLNEKAEILQAIEEKAAIDQHRLPCMVSTESLEENIYGYHNGGDIVINRNKLNDPDYMEIINTLFHEGSHARDMQSEYFYSIRETMHLSDEEYQERMEPIPDPDIDFDGYYYHKAEIAAREAGSAGSVQVIDDREKIAVIDREIAQSHPRNQILTIYDYDALGSQESRDEMAYFGCQNKDPDAETEVSEQISIVNETVNDSSLEE